MARADAERWVALEFVGAVVIRTLYGFRQQNALLGPQNYAAILVAYGFLSVLVLSDTTADIGAILGALILLAILLRPTPGGLLGGDTAGSLARFTSNVAGNPVSLATGATAASAPRPRAAAQLSSTTTTSPWATSPTAGATGAV